jgi:hypothetical protein
MQSGIVGFNPAQRIFAPMINIMRAMCRLSFCAVSTRLRRRVS